MVKIKFKKVIEILKFNSVNYSIIGDVEELTEYCLASIKSKIENGLYFITSEYIQQTKGIKNSIILTDSNEFPENNNIYIKIENPQLVHYKLASYYKKEMKPGIHATAIIDKEAIIDKTAYIGPYCIIGASIIKENVQLLHHITLEDNVEVNENTVIEGNSTIGARGMAWIWDDNGERILQPQLGGVIIGKNCLLGTDITIVRGSLNENTFIGDDTIIAHGTKVGHGCIIGEKVHFANNVSLAGNTIIKDRVFLGSGSVVSSNVIIEEGCIIGAGAVVNKSFNQKNCTLVGVPATILKSSNFESKPNGAPKPFKK